MYVEAGPRELELIGCASMASSRSKAKGVVETNLSLLKESMYQA